MTHWYRAGCCYGQQLGDDDRPEWVDLTAFL